MAVVKGKSLVSNGIDEHPAVINRAWSPSCVNLTVFPDCGTSYSRTSVPFYQSREEAENYLVLNPNNIAAFWPDRV